LVAKPAAEYFFGQAKRFLGRRHGIDLCRVIEVDSVIQARVKDSERGRFVRLRPESHRSHADIGNRQAALAKSSLIHESNRKVEVAAKQ
jgi:hypothetical protein